jgi:L,D-transpeptidase catalytic domain
VYENGVLVRTMPTSMGMGGTQTIGGRTLSFWTPPGIYTVMDKANPVIMDSSTFGLPINSQLGYRVTIPYATRISTDGIYLHQLNATVWAQGNTDTSHGCLNLNGDNATWFFNFSLPGDVVEVRNTGGASLQLGRTATGPSRGTNGATAARYRKPPRSSRAGTLALIDSLWRVNRSRGGERAPIHPHCSTVPTCTAGDGRITCAHIAYE